MKALFLIFCLVSGLAAQAELPAITRAQKFFLENNRPQATLILREAMQKEKSGTPAYRELADTLRELSARFLTDRGQKLFELGETLSLQNPKGAADRYREALTVEDKNTQILLALSMALLAQQKCSEAEKTLTDATLENPGLWEAQLLLAPTLLCLDKGQEFSTHLARLEKMEAVPRWWLKYFRARYLLTEEQPLAARALLESVRSEEKSFPESYFLLWSAEKDAPLPPMLMAQKYVGQCKNLSPKTRAQFKYEPNLCREIDKVDVWLKSHSTQ